MKKNKTIIILIISIITATLAIGVFVFFLKVIKNKNEHISIVLSEIEEKTREKEEATIFAEKVTEIKSLQDSIASHFLDSNKVDTFVDYLEKIGMKLGSSVSVKSIEIPPEVKDVISAEISVSGRFQEVMETIIYLENIPYQVNVTKLYLNKNTKEEQGELNVGGPNSSSQNWEADISFIILKL
jgi:hypothetical protein